MFLHLAHYGLISLAIVEIKLAFPGEEARFRLCLAFTTYVSERKVV